MPLTVPESPQAGWEIIRSNVPRLLNGLWALDGGSPEIARPYPLYTSTIPALLEGRLLASAMLTAWSYPLFIGESPLGVAELAATSPDGEQQLRFAALHPAEYAPPILEAIARAEGRPEVAHDVYEVRILRAPSVMLLAVWLHGKQDLLIPITPRTIDTGIETWSMTTEATLTESLRELAQVRLTAKDF